MRKRAVITKKRKGQIALKKKPRIAAHINRLYKAVQKYVEKGGGKLLVIGGIEIQEWPLDPPHVFRVGVRCLGRKPEFVPSVEPNGSKSDSASVIPKSSVISYNKGSAGQGIKTSY
jgi:hypothetical protein